MARMILLGVGTAVPDHDRENTHMVWDGPGGPLLIDAGGSTYQRLLRAGINPQQLSGVVLTHSHADHINGFFSLIFALALAGRDTPLPIYGLDATLALVQRILEAFQLDSYVPLLHWVPVEAGGPLPLPDTHGWQVQTALTRHPRPCLALRFANASGQPVLVYSCDTAPCEAVAALAHGAHALIHEATMAEPSTFHTTPREAGQIAQAAGAQRLVLVHFSPRYTMSEQRALAEIRAGGFTGEAEIGQEYQVMTLS